MKVFFGIWLALVTFIMAVLSTPFLLIGFIFGLFESEFGEGRSRGNDEVKKFSRRGNDVLS